MIRNKSLTVRSGLFRGFTLIELLTVVAVIGILASILIPVVGGARKSAVRAKSKAQFQGWATALVAYNNEYGYYPKIGSLRSSGNETLAEITAEAATTNSTAFVEALSGRNIDGTTTGFDSELNPRRIPFYSFAESEFFYDESKNVNDRVIAGLPVDGFNNPNIHIAVDHDGDGIIKKSGLSDLPTNNDLPADYRGRVLIWTKANAEKGFEDVMTWK